MKILLESDQLFGPQVKKIFKYACKVINLDHLKRQILNAYDIETTISQMTVLYYDQDVSDYAELDKSSCEEFQKQTKKVLRLSTSGEFTIGRQEASNPIVPVATEVPKSHLGVVDPSAAPLMKINQYDLEEIVSVRNTQRRFQKLLKTLTIQLPPDFVASVAGDASVVHNIWLITSQQPGIGCIVTHVNGIQISDLDKDFQLALVKQKKRPLLMEFQIIPEENRMRTDSNEDDVSGGALAINTNLSIPVTAMAASPNRSNKIKLNFFLLKYNHHNCIKIRSRVDKTIQDYLECDWALAQREGTGLPQATITSIYRYIESEMVKLDMFNAKRSRGEGAPEEMSEANWDELREHVEGTVFRRIAAHTKTLWPIFSGNRSQIEDFDENSTASDLREEKFIDVDLNVLDAPTASAAPERSGVHSPSSPGSAVLTELSDQHSLHMKMAFLRFITIENLGLKEVGVPKAISGDDKEELGTVKRTSKASRTPTAKQLGLKEEWYLAMKGLCRAMQFETPGEILQKLVSTSRLISHALHAYVNNADVTKEEHIATAAMRCGECGKFHFAMEKERSCVNLENHEESLRELGTLLESTCLARCQCDDQLKEHEGNQLSADELMPAITWVVIQANPPNVEYILWLCSEFRHPSLLRGEEAYCIAQLSSAVEFCRRAKASAFDIRPEEYSEQMLRYNNTLKLLIACKVGRYSLAASLVEKGVDVNGLSPDFRDTPLTASIRYEREDIFQLLLKQKGVQVDTAFNLYYGAHQRSTALLLATELKQYFTVLALLAAGANRYLSDDSGVTALSLAQSQQCNELEMVLEADPDDLDLIKCIVDGNERLVAGMLLQGVKVNYLAGEGLQLRSPLMEAVAKQSVEMVRLLLSARECATDVNLRNAVGQHALILCSKQCALQPTAELVIIAAMLLRAGAERRHVDQYQRSALDYVRGSTLWKLLKSDKAAAVPNYSTLSPYHLPEEGGYSAQHAVPVDGDLQLSLLTDMQKLLQMEPGQVAIFEVAKDGDLSGMKALLFQAVEVNVLCPKKGYSPLIACVYNKDLVMLDLLLQADRIDAMTNGRTSHWFEGVPTREKTPMPAPLVNKTQPDMLGRGKMTALHYAAQVGEVPIVGRLLQAGASRVVLNNNNHTALDVALTNNHIEAANILRYDPATISLCQAAKHGDWAVMEALLWQGVSINLKRIHEDNKGGIQHDIHTPLIAAIAHGQTAIVDKLLQMPEIDVNITNLMEQTPLMYAAAKGDESLVLRLLKQGADRWAVDAAKHNAAYWAFQRGATSLETLLNHDPAVMYIHDVIRKNDFSAVVAMLKQKVDVNQVRVTASSRRSSEPSATPEKVRSGSVTRKESPAISNLDESIIPQELRRSSVDPNAAEAKIFEGETPLIVAARYNRLDVIALLLKAPEIDVNRSDAFGWTALFHAAYMGHEDSVLMLVKARASRLIQDNRAKTAANVAAAAGNQLVAAIIEADPYTMLIHDQCEKGSLLHVTAILKQGCPPNFRDERKGKLGQTPLMAACSGGQVDVVRMLLRIPAVVEARDAVDEMGRTALMRAAGKGALDCTALLLNAGCDRNLKDREGLTARDHAGKHSYSVMFQFASQNMIR